MFNYVFSIYFSNFKPLLYRVFNPERLHLGTMCLGDHLDTLSRFHWPHSDYANGMVNKNTVI